MKKIIAGLLSVAIATAIMSMPIGENIYNGFSKTISAKAYYYGDYRYTILDDDSIELTSYSGGNVNMPTIPSEIDGKAVTSLGNYLFWNHKGFRTVSIPSSITKIGNNAFMDCSNLTNLIISNSVKVIGNGAFNNCSSLKNVTLGNSVESIGGMAFSGCTNLEKISVPNTVKYIGGSAFRKCEKLENFILPNTITSIEDSTFEYCSSLTDIIIPDTVANIGSYAFMNCSCLEKIAIPDSVENFGDSAFNGTKWIENKRKENPLVIINNNLIDCKNCRGDIIIPEGIKRIPSNAFSMNSRLTSIELPESIISIGKSAFSFCSNLNSIKIPSNVTSIAYNTFEYCRRLSEITFGKNVTSIGESALSDCTNLKDIYYSGTEEDWNKISISSGNSILKNVAIHYNYVSPNTELQGKIYYQQNLKDNSQIRFIAEVGIDDIEKANKGNYSVKVGDNEFGDEFYTAYLSIIANGKQVKAGDGKCFVVTPVVKQIPKGIDVTSIFNIDTYYIGLKRTISF